MLKALHILVFLQGFVLCAQTREVDSIRRYYDQQIKEQLKIIDAYLSIMHSVDSLYEMGFHDGDFLDYRDSIMTLQKKTFK